MQSDGIDADIAAVAGFPPRRGFDAPSATQHDFVRYVEDKTPDYRRLQEILELSVQARQWANFGPVSQALERSLKHLLALPEDRDVIVCSSATFGLNALAGLHAASRGRPLRWAVSAYTFANQRTGAFADSHVVDCTEQGMIDLSALARLPEESWDGLVVTNLFASLADIGPYAVFCRDRGKAIILDSAAALFGRSRLTDDPAETISFHHTKPWGFGEGGCVVVNRDEAPLIRSALNCGIGWPDAVGICVGNGKMAEVAAAAILERLERLPGWGAAYRQQRARIEALCHEASLPLLLQPAESAILASVPVLAARPLARAELPNLGFDIGKYYPPLPGANPTARCIFAHIANVPAHGGMAGVATERIGCALRELAVPAGEGAR